MFAEFTRGVCTRVTHGHRLLSACGDSSRQQRQSCQCILATSQPCCIPAKGWERPVILILFPERSLCPRTSVPSAPWPLLSQSVVFPLNRGLIPALGTAGLCQQGGGAAGHAMSSRTSPIPSSLPYKCEDAQQWHSQHPAPAPASLRSSSSPAMRFLCLVLAAFLLLSLAAPGKRGNCELDEGEKWDEEGQSGLQQLEKTRALLALELWL